MQIEYRGSGPGNSNLSGWVRKKDALVFWQNEGKILERKYINKFFCKLARWHLAISLRFSGILSK